MNRTVVLTLAAVAFLGACSDHKPTSMAAASPELLSAQPAPPAVEAPPVAMPPLPSVNAGDATATLAPEKPTPVDAAAAPATDSAATDPKGTLTKTEETNSMPMAAHGNNHSSPSLESRPSDSPPPK
jgi:hypothetical protein